MKQYNKKARLNMLTAAGSEFVLAILFLSIITFFIIGC